MTMPVIRVRNQTLVQTAKVWPTDDGGWTTQKAWCLNANDGLANDVGSATIHHPAGKVIRPGKSAIENLVPLDIVGQYVRILQEDAAAGTVSDADSGKYYTPIWWGKITKREWKPATAQVGLDVTYEAAGLLSLFDQITPFQHFEVGQGGLVSDITMPLVFNERNGKKSSNRSALVANIGGTNTYVFDRSSVYQWDAGDALDYLLAVVKLTNPGGPVWSVSGATTALDYIEKWDISGMTVLEAVSRLINPRQGLGYRLEMVSGQPTIHVMSMAQTAISVTHIDTGEGAYDWTLPASVEMTPLDLTDPTEIIDFAITEQQTATYDQIALIGGPDVYVATFEFKADGSGNIIRFWTDSDETTWASADTVEPDDPDAMRFQGALARTYLRFTFADAFNGRDYKGNLVIQPTRVTSNADPHGNNGINGDLQAVDAPLLEGGKYTVMRDLPLAYGYNWDTEDPTIPDASEQPERPKVFVKEGTSITPLAQYLDGRSSIEIQVDEDVGAITLGPADIADDIRQLIDSGSSLLFTIAIKHQLPLMVSWIRADSAAPTEQARSIVRLKPQATRKTIMKDTLFRAIANVPYTRAATTLVYSDVDDLRTSLAMAVVWFSLPNWELSWSIKGVITTAMGKPGTLYTSVTHLDGSGGTITKNINAIVTKREWDFSDGTASTRVSTKRIQVDIETIF